jgi:hypothetical protein
VPHTTKKKIFPETHPQKHRQLCEAYKKLKMDERGFRIVYVVRSIFDSFSFDRISACYNIWNYVGGLCGLVVRVHGYRSRGPGFDSLRYQIFSEK